MSLLRKNPGYPEILAVSIFLFTISPGTAVSQPEASVNIWNDYEKLEGTRYQTIPLEGRASWMLGDEPPGTPSFSQDGVTAENILKETTFEKASSQNEGTVIELQKGFQKPGFNQGCPVDDWFGASAEREVREFQRSHGLEENEYVAGVFLQKLEKRKLESPTGQSSPASQVMKPRVSENSGWVSLKGIDYARQKTNHTCGPASLRMALSVFGINVTEEWLARMAGTGSSGTSHSGLGAAAREAGRKFNVSLSVSSQSFPDTGWGGLLKMLGKGIPVIINLKSWYGNWGHYVLLAGINITKQVVRLADPSGGWRTVTFKEMERRMLWRSRPNILPVIKK